MIPNHFFSYDHIQSLIDLLQDEYEDVFTDPVVIYNLITLNFPEENIELEDVQTYFNTLPEELDRMSHLNSIGFTY